MFMPFQATFPVDRKAWEKHKIKKRCVFVHFLLVTQFGALAAIRPWWGNWYQRFLALALH